MFFLTIFLVNFYLYFNPKTLMTENQCPTHFFIYSHQTQTFFQNTKQASFKKIIPKIPYDKSIFSCISCHNFDLSYLIIINSGIISSYLFMRLKALFMPLQHIFLEERYSPYKFIPNFIKSISSTRVIHLISPLSQGVENLQKVVHDFIGF